MEGWQVAAVWPAQHPEDDVGHMEIFILLLVFSPEGDVNHLEVLGACGRGDLPGPGPDVVNHGVLEPRQPEVEALSHEVVLDTANPAC